MNREAEIESCARDSEQEFVPVKLFLNGNGNGDGSYCNGEFSFTFNDGKLTRFMWGSIDIPLALPKQEPVAWIYSVGDRKEVLFREFPQDELVDGCSVTPLYTLPPNIDALIAELRERMDGQDEIFTSNINDILNKWEGAK